MRPTAIAIALFLGVLAATSGGPSAAPAAPAAVAEPAGAQQRPNVVVIMADDMRNNDLRWMPKTRGLAAEGVRFVNSFAPLPLCCPARGSFLTGQYAHNHGVWSHKPPSGFRALDDTSTLPVWLKAAGYNTLFLGKYLNGYGNQPLPGGRPSVRYVPPGWTDWRGAIDGGGLPSTSPLEGGTYRYFDMTLNVNGVLQAHQGRYSTRLLGDQSVGLIRKYAPSSRPFFLWASYVAPHYGGPVEADDPPPVKRNDGKITKIVTPGVPFDVKGRFDHLITKASGLPAEADVSDKPIFIRSLPPINRAERKAMLEAARQRSEALSVLDAQVARTLEALRQAGELQNTLVVFTSDNGYFQGEHRMRQGKMLPYEPSLRVPLLIRGPGIPAGVTRNAPFLSIDFAPTILHAAGAASPDSVDGLTLLAIARAGGSGWRRPVLTETPPRGVVAHANEAGTPLTLGAPRTADSDEPYSVGVRTTRYLYVQHLNGERELYDMQSDPGQLHNVAGQPAYAADQQLLATVLADLRHCTGVACRRPLSSW